MTVDQIVEAVGKFPAEHVVVTGGEPMIAPQVVELTERLRERGLHITIETAGTVHAPVACDLMSISPKLKNSVPLERDGGRWAAQHERTRWQPAVLKQLVSAYEFQLKFVMADPNDIGRRDAEGSERSARESAADAGRHKRGNHSPTRPVAG